MELSIFQNSWVDTTPTLNKKKTKEKAKQNKEKTKIKTNKDLIFF